MRKLARPLVCMLAVLSLGYVSTGLALAFHIGSHASESGCSHDSHQHKPTGHDHQKPDHPEKDDHDGRHCSTCWQLGVIAKQILSESPSLAAHLTALEFVLPVTANQHIYSYTIPSLQPRAPPA
jgi:hypothetical protein